MNRYLPAKKSSFEIGNVEAANPPTVTCEFLLNKIPLGLTKKTCPLAWMEPRMTEGSAPTTRFSTTDDAEGWRNCTFAPSAIENEFQSTTSFDVD